MILKFAGKNQLTVLITVGSLDSESHLGLTRTSPHKVRSSFKRHHLERASLVQLSYPIKSQRKVQLSFKIGVICVLHCKTPFAYNE